MVGTGELVFKGTSHHCFVNADGRPIALSKQYPEYDELLKKHTVEA